MRRGPRIFAQVGVGIAILVATAGVRTADKEVPEAGLGPVAVAATRQPFTSTIALEGVIEKVPSTVLRGASPGSEVQWLVPNGARVLEGDKLFRELGADGAVPLKELLRQQQKTDAELLVLEKTASVGPGPQRDALTLAQRVRNEALDRYKAIQASADAVLNAARVALAQANFRGTAAEIQKARKTLSDVETVRTTLLNGVRAEVDAANLQVQEANAVLNKSRAEAESKLAPLRRASADLAARVQRAQARAREVTARHDGVLTVVAVVVPVGKAAADRVVGELEAEGFVLTGNVDPSRLPNPVEKAFIRLAGVGQDIACSRTELQEAALSCFVPDGRNVAAGVKGVLQVVVAELQDVLVVPLAAVRMNPDGTGTVNVVEGNKTLSRTVRTGPSDSRFVVVTEGLAEKEMVLARSPAA